MNDVGDVLSGRGDVKQGRRPLKTESEVRDDRAEDAIHVTGPNKGQQEYATGV